MPDTNPANDRSSAEVVVDTRRSISALVINRVGDGCVTGATVDFFISVTEVGPAETSGPTSVTLELPVGLSFVTGSEGWACAAQGRSVVCETTDLRLATARLGDPEDYGISDGTRWVTRTGRTAPSSTPRTTTR